MPEVFIRQGLLLTLLSFQIPALIPHVLPLIRPFAFLCSKYKDHRLYNEAANVKQSFRFAKGEYWESEESIKKIATATPILFLTGRRDELVPPLHMDTLMANCRSDTRIRMVLQDGDHNDTCVQVCHR